MPAATPRRLIGVAGLADDVGVKIDGDNHARAHGSAHGDRRRVDQGAVDQPLATDEAAAAHF